MNGSSLIKNHLLVTSAQSLRWLLAALLLSAASLAQATHFEGAKWTAAELTSAGQFSGRMLHINSKDSTFRENSLTFNVYDADNDPGRTNSLLSVNIPNVEFDSSDPSFEIWESLPSLDLSSLSFGRYAIRYSGSARISSVTNNASTAYSTEVVVNWDGANASRPPVFFGPPLVRLTIGEDFDFLTSAFVQSLEPVTFELLTGTAAPNNAADPIPGMNFNPLNGNFSMNAADTLNLVNPGFYVAKFQVITESGAATQWDIMFRANTTSNNPPQLQPVPGGLEVTIGVGDTYSEPIQASDPDSGQTVTLSGQDLPANANLTVATGNPVNSTLTFTPDASQVNTTFPLVVEAKDNDSTTPLSDTVTVNVTVVADASSLPVIEISGNGNAIVAGDDQPSSSTGTNFGSVLTGDSLIRSYQIANLGQEDLQLSGSPSLVAISGTNAADFTVVSMPQALLAPGATTTFDIEFSPSANGDRDAVIRVDNNDLSNPFFQFAIGGNGAATPVPAIEVTGNGLLIPSGDISPRSEDSTFYGSVDFASGASITHTFLVVNSGSADLSLTGTPAVQISGPAASDYTVTQQPSALIAAGSNSQFVLEFDPSATGDRTATVSIASDDANFNPYTFDVQGFGISGPNMRVLGNGIKIVDGSTSPSTDDDTSFGSVNLGGNRSITYTLDNVGSADLNLTGTPLVSLSGADAADYTITSVPTTPVAAAGGQTSFTVVFAPSALGTRNASISIANDDVTVNPYNFDINGNGVSAPALSIDPASFDYGAVLIGSNAATSFTLSNTGAVGNNLSLTSIATTGAGYSVTGGSCTGSTVLDGGDNCSVDVQFAPTTEGAVSGSLDVASDANNVSAALSGSGLAAAALAIDLTSFDYGAVFIGSNAATTFTLSNTGDTSSSLMLASVAVTGADFSIVGGDCNDSTVLTGGNSCTVDVQFAPGTVGASNGSLTVGSDAGNVSAALDGEGLAAAALAIDPVSLDFGGVLLADNTASSFTLSNIGDTSSSLMLASVAVTGADFSIVGGDCNDSTVLTGGNSCTVDVQFAPGTVGASNGSLTVGSDAGNVSAALDGEGLAAAALAIDPVSLDFGGVLLADNTASSFTLSNIGDSSSSLDLTSIAVTGTDFTDTGNGTCTNMTTLGGGDNCTVEVQFAPNSVAILTGNLAVQSDAGDVSADITGEGIQPAIEITPASLNFGDQEIDTTSAEGSVTIANTGTSDLNISSVSMANAPFAQTANGTCSVPAVLTPTSSCTLTYTFSPTATGTQSTSIVVLSDAPNSPTSFSLVGNGVMPALAVNPAAINFDDFETILVGSQSGVQTVQLSNAGSTPLTIDSVTLAGSHAADFVISSNGCPDGTILNSGLSCSVDVFFAPTDVGARSVGLQINSNAPTSPDTVALSGTGAEVAALQITPTSFDFGGVLVGNDAFASFSLANTGDAITTLALTAPMLAAGSDAEFSITGGDCTAGTELIGAGAACTVEITFAPTSLSGPFTGTLEVGSDANAVTAALSGNALPPAELAIDSANFDFAGVVVGETANTNFVLSNSGDVSSSLSLTAISTTGTDFSVIGGDCVAGTTTLSGGDSCSVEVQFAPTAEGAASGSLDVTSDAGDVNATLSGEGLPAAGLQITPESFDYGSVLITESATRSFSLSNTGDAVTTVTLTAPMLATASAAEFSITGGDCAAGTALIGGGADCTVEVTFDPTSVAASLTGTLEVGSDVNNVSAALSAASELPDWADGFASTDPGSGGFEQEWSFLGFDAMFNPLAPTTAAVSNDYLQIRDPAAIFAVGYVERTFNDTRTSALVNADGLGSGTDSGDSLDNQIDQGVIARFDPATTSGYAAYMRMELTAQELVLIKFDASNIDPALVDLREVVATSDDDDWNMGRMFITELDLIDQADGSVLVVARALDADSGAVLSRLEFNDPAVDAFATGFSGVVAIANATGLNGSFDTTAAVSAFASADLAPDSIDFGALATGATAQQTVNLSNNGNDALVISDIAISGTAAADYTLQNDTCMMASPLPAGASCTFDVELIAGDTGQRSAEVLIDSSASTSPDVVLLDAAVFASQLTLNPLTQDFGAVLVGASSSPITFTVSNAGDAVTSLALNSIATSGDFNAVGGNCTDTTVLNGGESCTVEVAFAPNSVGMLSGTLDIGSDAGAVSADLSGEGLPPAMLVIDPTSFDFGAVLVGNNATTSFTLSNAGDASSSLSLTSIATSGAQYSVIGGNCSTMSTLNGGGNCTVDVQFAATAVGAASGSLDISSDAGAGSATLTGTGTAPAIAINPISLDFGDQEINTTSAEGLVTIENTGTADLNISSVSTVNAPFTQTASGTCTVSAVLTPASSCTLSYTFSPTATGTQSTSIVVLSDAPSSPNSFSLTGTGVMPALAVNPATINFDDFETVLVGSQSGVQTVQLSNAGSTPLTIDSVTLAGSHAADFVISSNGCPDGSILNSGLSCSVDVFFAPTEAGARNAGLQINSNAPTSPDTLALSGTGAEVAALQITPESFDYGSVLITESATRSFSLSNTGDAVTTVTLTAPMLATASAAEFSITGGDCAAGTALIGGGADCTVEVTFDPISVAASLTGTLEVGSDVNNVSAALSAASELPDWADGFASTDPGSGGFEQEWSFLGFDAMFNPLVPTTAAVSNDYLQIRDPAAIFAVGYVERTFNDTRTSALVNADGLGSGTDSGDSLDNQIDQGVIARFDPATTSGYAAYMRMELTAQELVLIKFDASNLDPALVDLREVVATSDDDDWNMGRMFITELDLIDQADGSVLVVARALDADSGAVLSRLEFNDPAVDAFATGFSGVVAIANATGLNGSFDTTAAVSAFASADLAPDSIDFGALATGATAQQTVNLSNNGNDALVISDIAISGTAAADYTLQNDTCMMASPLPAGASCTFDVELIAGDTGQRSAEVLIDSSASTSPDVVLLDAAVFASDLTLTPQTQDFGAVLAGASSSPITFTVSNAGDAVTSLALNSIATSGDFNAVGGNCTDTTVLNGGESCTVEVAFAPSSVGMLSGSLDIGSDAGAVSADLSGEGLPPAMLVIDPTSFDFGAVLVGNNATTSFTLSNAGDISSSLDLSTITVNGAGFTATGSGTCTTMTMLGGGDSCTVEVQFAPNSVAMFSGSLEVQSNAGVVSASLTGDGLAAAELMVTPLDHDFGNVTVGESSVFSFTLSNNGDPLSELMLNDVNSSGNPAFSVVGGDCQSGVTMLNGQQSCTVDVQFAPAVLGDVGGSLNASSDVNAITAGLVGAGTELAAIQLAPGSLDFGQLPVGDTSTESLVISNVGGAASTLTINGIAVSGSGYSVTGGDCVAGTTALAAAQSCTIEVTYAPMQIGTANGQLDVSSDAGAASATLTAEAVAGATLAVDPVSHDFGVVLVGDTADQVFTLTNTGAALSSTVLNSVTVTGAAAIGIIAGDCVAGLVLNGGESCTVTVQYAPVDVSAVMAGLDFSSDSGDVSASLVGGSQENVADLMLMVEPLDPFGELGAEFGYILVVANVGPADVTAADVTSTLATGLDNVTWTCSADTGAACPASGTGDLNEMVDLPAGNMVEFIIVADLSESNEQEQVISTFTVTGPMMPPDPDTSNNTTEISTQSGVFADGLESPPEVP